MWYVFTLVIAIIALAVGYDAGIHQEVRIVTDEPVTCVVELNQAAGLNQQTIRYEGKVK